MAERRERRTRPRIMADVSEEILEIAKQKALAQRGGLSEYIEKIIRVNHSLDKLSQSALTLTLSTQEGKEVLRIPARLLVTLLADERSIDVFTENKNS